MSQELKPCPFCGGEATICKTMDEDLWSHNIVPYHKVGCNECEIWTEFRCEGYEPTAFEAWNNRTKPPGYALVPAEPTEAMIEAAEEAYMPFGAMELAYAAMLSAAPKVGH